MVRAPRLVVLLFEGAQHVLEPRVEVGERRDGVRALEDLVGESLVEHVLLDEIDQRIRLGIDVVLVEQHLGVLEHFAQTPRERGDVAEQCFVAAQRVQRNAIGLVRRVVLDVLKWRGRHAALRVQHAVVVVDLAGEVEEAEIRPLHVEAERRDAALLFRKVREDRLEQPLDGARLRREARDAGDVEVRRFRADEKISVQIDRRVRASRAIHAHRNPGVRAFLEIPVHPQRDGDVGLVGEEHRAHGHRLKWLLGDVPQHRRGVEPNLRTLGRRERLSTGLSVMPHHVVQRRCEVSPAESLGDDAVDARNRPVHRIAPVDADDCPDADRRVERRPEMEFVRRVWTVLGGHDSAKHCWHQDPRANLRLRSSGRVMEARAPLHHG